MRATLAAATVLLVLLAGCTGGNGGGPSASTTSTGASASATSTTAAANATRLPPEETFNQTFSFQVGASVSPGTFEVSKPWSRLNFTATLRNTSQCYALVSEARSEGSVSQPAVAVTSPSGQAFEVPLLAAAGCQPGSPPDFLVPSTSQAPAELGGWTVQPKGWGQNMELRVVAVALP